MSADRSRRLTVAAWLGAISLNVVGLGFLWAGSRDLTDVARLAQLLLTNVTGIIFGATALILLLARPWNRVGWLLMVAGIAGGANVFGEQFRNYGRTHAGALPATEEIGRIGDLGWIAMFAVLCVLIQVFPTGRSLTPRWRWLAYGTLIWAVAAQFASALSSAGPGVYVLSIATLVMRYRRADLGQRLQIKWLAFAMIASLALFAGTGLLYQQPGPLRDWLGVALYLVLFIGPPAAIAVAILRYRLYDIDVVINRTLVYGGLSAILAMTYFAIVVILQTMLRPFTSGSELAVAGSTLAVVGLFQPVRRRVQNAVDRRFYRSRYDAVRTLDAFTSRLRNDVELESVRTDLLRVVDQTVRPTHASLWLRWRAP